MAERNPDRASYFPAIEKKHGLPMDHWFDEMKKIADLKYPEQIAYLRENHGFSQAHANALVLYSRGSTSSRRFATFDEYLATANPTQQKTMRAIYSAITKKYPAMEIVIAWNQPMLTLDGQYIFGASVQKHHILIAPWGDDVLEHFRPRLTDYVVNKKTIKVPDDWKVDAKLLQDMAGERIAQLQT
jgi:uncharacterized protein YdhG (YjbR/CyaY superfamily)